MQRVTYVRLFTDENGESLFEDLYAELQPVDFAPPGGSAKYCPV